jgi:hypothetical protein
VWRRIAPVLRRNKGIHKEIVASLGVAKKVEV